MLHWEELLKDEGPASLRDFTLVCPSHSRILTIKASSIRCNFFFLFSFSYIEIDYGDVFMWMSLMLATV